MKKVKLIKMKIDAIIKLAYHLQLRLLTQVCNMIQLGSCHFYIELQDKEVGQEKMYFHFDI